MTRHDTELKDPFLISFVKNVTKVMSQNVWAKSCPLTILEPFWFFIKINGFQILPGMCEFWSNH